MAPDITAITAIFSNIKTATELAKLIKDSGVSLDAAETKLKLAELLGSLAEIKIEAAELKQTLLDKDNRIRELEDSLKVKQRLRFDGTVYWLKEVEEGDAEEGPFCPQCQDNTSKLIRLQHHGGSSWKCKTCGHTFRRAEQNQ